MTADLLPAVAPLPPRAWTALRVVLCGSTLLMLGLSWPLWLGPSGFPQVPFVLSLATATIPLGLSRVLYPALLLALLAATTGLAWRSTLALSACLLGALLLEDQNRFQPWAYQFLLWTLALAACPPEMAAGLCRLFVVAMYVHSGLSKLDVSFCRELGQSFLATMVRPLGSHPASWPASARYPAILAMPAWELLVGLGLAFRRTRRLALVGAVALHAALILVLGPFGLGQSPNVLVWNGAMIVETVLLFGFLMPGDRATAPSLRLPGPAALVRTVFLLAAVLPLGERWGVWDTWPSFALYASHVERTDILLHEADLAALPEAVRRHARTPVGQGWRRLDLTGWSRALRGVPVYPQARVGQGVAEALAVGYPLAHSLRLIQWGRADRWTGQRKAEEAWGADAIRRLGERYRLNAHPAGFQQDGQPARRGRP